jgi:hypothetical protein
MFQAPDPAFSSVWRGPTVGYLYFQVSETVALTGLRAFGEPVTNPGGSSVFLWQLFKTTADWQTPNGNDDRLFYAFSTPSNLGASNYLTPVFSDPTQSLCGPVSNEQGNCPSRLILESGAFYRLSLQINGPVDWLMQFHSNESGQPFSTSNGLFRVFGYGDPPIGPLPYRTESWSLMTADVPEPATWALMIGGIGLSGVALRRHRRLPAC